MYVTTCNDEDATVSGSLRYAALHAPPGAMIDFSQLPIACGMADSTITLTAGQVIFGQNDISLVGPSLLAPGGGTVTISGGGASRIFGHYASSPYSGTLYISNLRIVDGYMHSSGDARGGCIYSRGNIFLAHSVVASCTARSDLTEAFGGAVASTHNKVSLRHSSITGNTAASTSPHGAYGGGISAPEVSSKYSEITANNTEGGDGFGGGVRTTYLAAMYSTIADNSADIGGGVFIDTSNVGSTILNSTLTGNHSLVDGGGAFVKAPTLTLANSTVAFNTSYMGYGGGIKVAGTTTDFESTIIARNSATDHAVGADVYVANGTVAGADNLIMSSNTDLSAIIASSSDPNLSPNLAWLGGPTRALGLLSGSPAIAIGHDNTALHLDQRGPGYPRATGPANTVDIGAVQYDSRIFFSSMDL